MIKRIVFTLLGLALLGGLLGGVKGLQIQRMIAQGEQFVPPPETVTTAAVRSETWESVITAVGSLEAVQGVTVAAELSGKVVRIAFEPGQAVQAGDLLLEQDTSTEKAQLRAIEASLALAKTSLDRANQLLSEEVIPKQSHDKAVADYRQALAEADSIRAAIDKKTIRAPFSGRLGTRLVNLGQILREGDEIVSLQAMDPVFANFLLPQQDLARVRTGLTVRLSLDSLADRVIEGKITAINPQVDAATRNIPIQATVANSDERLRPGMFVNVEVVLPERLPVLTIPTTAVLYAPYSDSVFVVEPAETEGTGASGMVIRQQFVRLGEKRGDFIVVSSGLSEGQSVVSTGAFKLRTGQSVVVDNTLSPEFKLAPNPEQS